MITSYESLKLKAVSLRSKRDNTVQSLKTNLLDLQSLEQELQETTQSKANLVQSIDIMKQLIDISSREQINQLKDLITYGLKTIFTDRDYSLDIVVSESRSVKQANFYLVEQLPDGSTITSDFKDSIGGGVLSVVGLIIQVYYIIYYKQYPIIFMDEALSQISTQYIPSVLEFINQLAEKKHFKFVLISHDDRLIEYGRQVYQVHQGQVHLIHKEESNA